MTLAPEAESSAATGADLKATASIEDNVITDEEVLQPMRT